MRTTKEEQRNEELSVDDMRYDLAEAEAMNMNTSDIIDMLIYGCEGIESTPDIEVRDEWNFRFGVDKD